MAATRRSLKLSKSRPAQATEQNLIYLKDKEVAQGGERRGQEGAERRGRVETLVAFMSLRH